MLTERLLRMRDEVRSRDISRLRLYEWDLREILHAMNVPPLERMSHLIEYGCRMEDPVVRPDEKIVFTRTLRYYSRPFNTEDLSGICGSPENPARYYANLCPDYTDLLQYGFSGLRTRAVELLTGANPEETRYVNGIIRSIDAVLDLARRYSSAAERAGNRAAAELLKKVPENPPGTLQEALQTLRFASAVFPIINCRQMGFGRLDQYLAPYYENERAAGTLDRQGAYELIAEFFISLNRDTPAMDGIYGDNGQSVMLGGCLPDGTCGINDLTYLMLEISRDLKLIDPKINLRVDSHTPEDLLMLGCELTRAGLGFPQYSNDEVVIPALIRKGYAPEDARNYSVAACWEFSIPGKGVEFVNQGAVSFPFAVDEAFRKELKKPQFSMDELRLEIRRNILEQTARYTTRANFLETPYCALFFADAMAHRKDPEKIAPYRNIGIHGVGASHGAEALAILKNLAGNQEWDTLRELNRAVDANWAGYEKLRDRMLKEMPKTGNDDPEADAELKFLFDAFADAAEELSSDTLKLRPGSGAAVFYRFFVDRKRAGDRYIGATIDGRKEGDPLASSLAPSNGVKSKGVLSVLHSFSHVDYSRIMNGGPITVEFAPAALNSEENLRKLVSLLKYFVLLGEQQIQLNILDVNQLKDALIHPENHRNLIVRVWGWSGYFCELPREYQEQIIARHQYAL